MPEQPTTSPHVGRYQARVPGGRLAEGHDVLASSLGAAPGRLALSMVERRLAAIGRPTPHELARPDQVERITPWPR